MTTTTPDLDTFDFTGAFGAEASKEGSKGGAPIRRIDWLKIDGSAQSMAAGRNKEIIRMLTDYVPVPSNPVPWITVDMHSMVPTKAAPPDLKDGQKWPRSMGAVCRNDKIFKANYGDCYICANIRRDNKPLRASGKTWALAVLREQVVGDQALVDAGKISPAQIGQVVGIRDKTREVAIIGTQEMATAGQIKQEDVGKPTGETEIVPAIVIVQQAYKNFFSHLEGFAGFYGTVLDRDYHITRNGDDTGTTYQIVPMDPIIIDAVGTKYDLRDPAQMAKYDLPDLRKFVAEQASNDHYARYFDPTKTPAPRPGQGQATGPVQGQQQAPPPPTPTQTNYEPDGDALQSLKSRVEGYGTTQAPEPAAAPAGAPGGMQAL